MDIKNIEKLKEAVALISYVMAMELDFPDGLEYAKDHLYEALNEIDLKSST